MTVTVEIKRQKTPSDKPYYESFVYEGDGRLTVADYLGMLNRDVNIKNADGKPTTKVAWECSCSEKKCGACAMLINGYPRLACAAFLCDNVKHGKITLAPLSKFPVLTDLTVDRTILLEMLKNMKIWQSDGEIPESKEDNKMMYRSAKCVLCGCCLEICPNFSGDNRFNGAFAMAAVFKAIKHNGDRVHIEQLKNEYRKHFFNGCGQSLACVDVCPFDVPHDELQTILNRKK